MKRNLIFKGLLLYVTILLSVMFISATNNPMLLIALGVMVGILIYICHRHISLREFYTLSLYKWFNNILKG